MIEETVIKPHYGGFGMYDCGEWTEVEGAEDIRDWLLMAADNDCHLEPADEISGSVYDLGCGRVYRDQDTGCLYGVR